MYELLPSFVLGFHGCDQSVAESVFAGREQLKPSRNRFDWLGHGVYFWEQSPTRAMQHAQMLIKHPNRSKDGRVEKPAVIGAVIDLGVCLNLLDAQFLSLVRIGYEHLREASIATDSPLPQNRAVDPSGELLLRPLDCAVIEMVHELRSRSNVSSFDSVRGMFTEGEPLYEGAGFHARNHIQICVRNHRCIKGYFRVMAE